ncbi:MAG: 50S ribosomal protein L23 [Candidatus Nanohaloarchaeota archaeon QJJ-9]|nr:50S ribosomal protein L23 [Candidatus Nanohaloarchaeota archaeon QJJ-9]
MESNEIIKHPHLTEKSVGKVDEENTLVFIVDERSNRLQVKDAVESMFDVEVEKVNTLITQDGEKKAFVRLTDDYEALDVATKLGML